MSSLGTIWIIHRDPHQRAALARIAGAADNTLLGAPGDRVFDSAPPADCIVLGLCDDFELELEFAHRIAARLHGAAWILVVDDRDREEARRLFDLLPATVLRSPPDPERLRAAIRGAVGRRSASPLSLRRTRRSVAGRFARWFGALELPDLLRALDPRMAALPLLVRGEPGSGRGLVARYVDALGGTDEHGFAKLACAGVRTADALLEQLPARAEPLRAQTLFLEDVDRLPRPLQSLVRDWIEYASGPLGGRGARLRWMASCELPEGAARTLDPALERALGGIVLRIPPLRERPECIEPLVVQTAEAFARERGQRPPRFADDALEVLRSHPWPGDRSELEAVVLQTLVATAEDPIRALHLVFGGTRAAAPHTVSASQPERPEAEPERADPPENPLAPPVDPWEPSNARPVAPPATEADVEPGQPGPPTREAWRRPNPADRSESTGEEGAATGGDPRSRSAWLRLAGAVAHEVRNPLVSIRTFAELLPESYEDEEFRTRFSELVGADVRRIEQVVDRLQRLGELPDASRGPVDLSALLHELLEQHSGEIERRRLLVLEELDVTRPLVVADAEQLRGTLDALIGRALSRAADAGDVYLASKHHEAGLHGEPSVRLLLRYQLAGGRDIARSEGPAPVPGLTEDENALEYAVAEAVVQTHGGSFTADTSDPHERVIVIDLPAPM